MNPISLSYSEFHDNMQSLINFRNNKEVREQHLDSIYGGSVIDDCGEDLFESYINLLTQLMSDEFNWISYFLWDCDCGKNPQKVFIDEEEATLKDVPTLYQVIRSSNARPQEL